MRILATLAFALALAAGSAYANVQFINDDFETGMADARSKKLPLLVYFHTTWCSWCVEMENKVFTDDEVSDKSNFFVPVRLNCDRRAGQAVADRYQVTSYPT